MAVIFWECDVWQVKEYARFTPAASVFWQDSVFPAILQSTFSKY
jgi:hypothetical protein